MASQPTPKYVTHSPDSQMKGQALLGLMLSQQLEEFADLLEAHGLQTIDPEAWYPLEQVMAFMRDMMQRPNASTNAVSAGIQGVNVLPWPDDVTSAAEAILMLNQVNRMSLRNVGPEDHYIVESIDEQRIVVVDRSPFSHDAIYGLFYGIGRRFMPKGGHLVVTRDYFNPDDPDADGARYTISW